MTNQEFFDKVARHLLTQKKKALTVEMYDCMYRSSDGSKCAIGCFIPDELYSPNLEGKRATRLSVIFELLDGVSYEAINMAQDIHDNYEVDMWKFKLTNFAKYFGLNHDVLNEFPDA